jgi:hypothetical protein
MELLLFASFLQPIKESGGAPAGLSLPRIACQFGIE